jgi:ABC-type multidrug transport system ATPase subunit
MEEKIIINISKLSKYYGTNKVIDDISLNLHKGSIIGLVGVNGSGKTTFLSILAGLIIDFEGIIDSQKNIKIGSLIEEPVFFNHLSGYDNLKLVAKINNIPHFHIDNLLKKNDLIKDKDKKYGQYSLGMKQRLGIVATLVAKPDLILLDEPTNGLDPIGIKSFRDSITEIATPNNCVIISSHQLKDIELICTHLLVISEGKNLFFGTKVDFISKFEGKESFENIVIKLIDKIGS